MHTISETSTSRFSGEDVYATLKKALGDSQYAPGEYLREAQIAKSMGVSRTPVREALQRLASEGWLEIKPNYGARVKHWSTRDVEEIFEARLLVEPYLAGRAALRITAEDIGTLVELAERMSVIATLEATPETTEQWFAANGTFHAIVTAAAGNVRLDNALKSMKEMPLIKWTYDTYGAADRRRSARQHVEIVEALVQRNQALAEAITRCHILAAEQSVQEKMKAKMK